MTTVALPYLNKLSGTYSKKVTFKNFVCAAHNNYIRKMGNGLACVTTEYSLKYIGLTDAELAAVETLFSTHDLDSFIEFQSPIDLVAADYRKPVGWKKDSYTEILGNTGAVVKERRHTVSFSLVKNLSADEILAIQEVLGELQLVDDFALLPSGYTEAYVQCFDNDTLPYGASGANYNALLYKNGTETKTITVAGEGVWSISNYGTATFIKDNAFNGTPTPIQYVVYDKWSRKSNYAWINLKNLTQTTSWGRGGWYGGDLNSTEIWITDVAQSYNYGNSCTEYKIHKTTGVNSRITEIPNDDYRREVKKIGNYWFTIAGAYEVRNLAYSVLFLSYSPRYKVEYDPVENKSYYIVNAGGNWSYGTKTGLLPPNTGDTSVDTSSSDWVYDADYPSNGQGSNVNELALSTNFVWYSSIALQKVEAVSRNWESGVYGVINTIFPLPSAKYNLARKSISVANSVNSRMVCSPNFLFITQPLLGKLAKIDLVTGNLTSLSVVGLLYTPEDWTSKPSFLAWLPEINRLAVSCLGNNTLKLFTEDGTLTHTFSTGLKPGRAFIVGNVLYVPCMEQNVTNRFLF